MGDKEPAGHCWCLSGGRLLVCVNTEIARAAINGGDNSTRNTLSPKSCNWRRPFCGERFASSEAAWKPGLNIPDLEKVFGVLYLIREIAAH